MTLRRRAIALVALILAVTAGAIVLILQLTVSNLGGPGLPIQLDNQSYQGETIRVDGRLHVAENGCFEVVMDDQSLFAIWPQGWKMEGASVVAPDGARFTEGTALVGEGVRMSYSALIEEDGGPDGYWGSIAGFCMENHEDLVVVEFIS